MTFSNQLAHILECGSVRHQVILRIGSVSDLRPPFYTPLVLVAAGASLPLQPVTSWTVC